MRAVAPVVCATLFALAIVSYGAAAMQDEASHAAALQTRDALAAAAAQHNEIHSAAVHSAAAVVVQDAGAGNSTNSTGDAGGGGSGGDDGGTKQIGNEHPFVEFNGLTDGSWAVFIMITITASQLGVYSTKLGLPLITGYMFIGTMAGPYILNMITSTQIPNLGYVTTMALAFIALSAGSELYLPEIKDLFRPIMWMSGLVAVSVMTLVTLSIYGLAEAGFVASLKGAQNGCVAAMSTVGASIMTARSPASAIAIVREMRAKGPFTSTMLGLTVIADVVVLLLYAVTASFGLSSCHGSGFDAPSFFITIGSLGLAIGLGYIMGKIMLFLLWIPKIPGEYTVLPLSFLVFISADWFALYSLRWGYSIDIDALFICIVGGYVVTNQSANRHRFMKLLGKASPYIFIPFFTKTGITLNLPVLAQSIVFGFVIFAVRGTCMLFGTGVGGHLGGLPKQHSKNIWMAQLTQAGVSLGLAARVAKTWSDIGSSYSTTLIAVILINQIIGPITTKMAIKNVNEQNKATDDDDEHGHGSPHGDAAHGETPKDVAGESGRKRLVVVGVDGGTALAASQHLLNKDWNVMWLDTDHTKLALTFQLQYKKTLVRKRDGAAATPRAAAAAGTPRTAALNAAGAAADKAELAAATATVEMTDVAALRKSGAGGDALPFVVPGTGATPTTPTTAAASAGAAAASKAGSAEDVKLNVAPDSAAQPPQPPQPQEEQSVLKQATATITTIITELPVIGALGALTGVLPRANDDDGKVEEQRVETRRVRDLASAVAEYDAVDDAKAAPPTLVSLYEAELDGLTPANTAAVLLLLPSDADNHSLARSLLTRKFTRVLVRVTNPVWGHIVACDGAVPLYPFSSELAVLEQSVTVRNTVAATEGVVVAKVGAGQSLATAMNGLIDSDVHLKYAQFDLSASQRESFLRAHPPPSKEDLERVKLNTFVTAAARDEYLSHMGALHSYGVSGDDGAALKKQADTFSISTGLMRLQAQEASAKRKQDAQDRAAADAADAAAATPNAAAAAAKDGAASSSR